MTRVGWHRVVMHTSCSDVSLHCIAEESLTSSSKIEYQSLSVLLKRTVRVCIIRVSVWEQECECVWECMWVWVHVGVCLYMCVFSVSDCMCVSECECVCLCESLCVSVVNVGEQWRMQEEGRRMLPLPEHCSVPALGGIVEGGEGTCLGCVSFSALGLGLWLHTMELYNHVTDSKLYHIGLVVIRSTFSASGCSWNVCMNSYQRLLSEDVSYCLFHWKRKWSYNLTSGTMSFSF